MAVSVLLLRLAPSPWENVATRLRSALQDFRMANTSRNNLYLAIGTAWLADFASAHEQDCILDDSIITRHRSMVMAYQERYGST